VKGVAETRLSWGGVAAPLIAVGACVGVGLLVLALLGHSPGEVMGIVWGKVIFHDRAERRAAAWSAVLYHTTPILLTGLAVTVAFRASVWNIGGEGQFLAGALAANAIGAHLALHSAAGIPMMLLVAGAAGAGLAAVASLLEWWRRVPVVLSTLLLNAVMVQVLTYLVAGPLGDPGRAVTRPLLGAYRLPGLVTPPGLLIALSAAGMVAFVLRQTTFGFRLRMVGENPTAARFAGVHVPLTALATLSLSGALAGLAGGVELAGVRGELAFSDANLGFGFTGIAVALLARLSPLAVIPSALFFGVMRSGFTVLEAELGVPSVTGLALQGLIVMLMLVLTHPLVARRLGALVRRMTRRGVAV
jgi:simple sugar transport system permease protein